MYTFELKCPRCKRESTHATIDKTLPMISCGDCLYNDVEVVELTIVRCHVTPNPKGANP